MSHSISLRLSSALAACLICSTGIASPAGQTRAPEVRRQETALDRYVRTPDPAYRFSVVEARPGEGHTAFLLEMVSQRWLTEAEVDRPEWKHWLTIIRPDDVAHEAALLVVAGGDWKRKPPERTDAGLLDIARTTRSVVAELRMVPNQPLVFGGDGVERKEDDLIAYTWDKFLRTGDERWPARLPMTKAVVRAMDTVTAFLAKPPSGPARTVDRFVVAGASKRGWTTWTTAAVDPRVIALVPIVIDVLNVVPSFEHHWRAYGFYAPAVDDYVTHRITDWLGTPQYRALMRIEDPYEYRDRLTMPKFLVNASGDQFFLPDSWRFYARDLRGETLLRYVPNADHGLKDTDAMASIAAFYGSVLTGAPRPRITWEAGRDGRITIRADQPPESVTLWTAANPAARDFRIETLGPKFEGRPLTPVAPGTWEARIAAPDAGWRAGFIEMRFRSGTKYPFVFTSGVTVVPDRLPHPSRPRPEPPGAPSREPR